MLVGQSHATGPHRSPDFLTTIVWWRRTFVQVLYPFASPMQIPAWQLQPTLPFFVVHCSNKGFGGVSSVGPGQHSAISAQAPCSPPPFTRTPYCLGLKTSDPKWSNNRFTQAVLSSNHNLRAPVPLNSDNPPPSVMFRPPNPAASNRLCVGSNRIQMGVWRVAFNTTAFIAMSSCRVVTSSKSANGKE
jgi:hypothetical protein